MAIELHNLKHNKGTRRKRKRVGRGNSSGRGTYSGRGLKGQRSRSGGKGGLKLKGMKSRLMKIPKLRGFKSMQPKPAIVNLSQLNKKFKSEATVTPKILLEKGLVDTIKKGVKILGKGNIEIKINVSGCTLSKGAEEKIKAAGGKVEKK